MAFVVNPLDYEGQEGTLFKDVQGAVDAIVVVDPVPHLNAAIKNNYTPTMKLATPYLGFGGSKAAEVIVSSRHLNNRDITRLTTSEFLDFCLEGIVGRDDGQRDAIILDGFCDMFTDTFALYRDALSQFADSTNRWRGDALRVPTEVATRMVPINNGAIHFEPSEDSILDDVGLLSAETANSRGQSVARQSGNLASFATFCGNHAVLNAPTGVGVGEGYSNSLSAYHLIRAASYGAMFRSVESMEIFRSFLRSYDAEVELSSAVNPGNVAINSN